jgi:hypothetical protein
MSERDDATARDDGSTLPPKNPQACTRGLWLCGGGGQRCAEHHEHTDNLTESGEQNRGRSASRAAAPLPFGRLDLTSRLRD